LTERREFVAIIRVSAKFPAAQSDRLVQPAVADR
jgi:hypothetical protein